MSKLNFEKKVCDFSDPPSHFRTMSQIWEFFFFFEGFPKNYTKNTFTLIPAMILYQLNKHLKTPDIEVTFSGLITIGE